MSPAQIGGILLLLGGLAFAFGHFAKIRVGLLLVGTILVGVGGHLFTWLGVVMTWLSGATSAIFAWAFGVALPAALAVILIFIVVRALLPRHKAGRTASIAAVALGIMIALGITNIGALGGITPTVTTNVSTVTGS